MSIEMIERDGPIVVTTGVHELARAVMAPGLSPAERVARARTAAAADEAERRLAPLLDPYATGEFTILGDLIDREQTTDPGKAAEARDRLLLLRQSRITIDRAGRQSSPDHPGLLPIPLAPSGTPSATPTPFLDEFATVSEPVGDTLGVPQAWDPAPVGTIVTPESTEPAPLGSHVDLAETPRLAAVAFIEPSRQLVKWARDGAREFGWLLDTAVSVALEQAMLGNLAAVAQVHTAADERSGILDALEAAESAVGAAWYTPATHLVVNPVDWPMVRRAWGAAGLWPAPLTRIVTRSQTAGRALMFSSTVVSAETSATQWSNTERPGTAATRLVAFRTGAAAARSAAAIAVIDLPAAGDGR